MKIVINATNLGQGGGVVQIKEFIERALSINNSNDYVIFAQQKILDELPENEFLEKISHPLLEKSLLHRLYFQLFCFDKFIPKGSIIFSVTGDYLGDFEPVIGMSQNMLLYERHFLKKMPIKEKIRFYINFMKQKNSFKKSAGLIFISKYSQKIIHKNLPILKEKDQEIIYHGVSSTFNYPIKFQYPITFYTNENPFVFTYISSIHTYKNHPNVIQAFAEVREMGIPVVLNLVGPVINNFAGKEFEKAIDKYDRDGKYIKYHGSIAHNKIAKFYEDCDALLFASSCETMPITVIESMLSGRPLLCSNLGPMPEFVKDNAYYFDPDEPESIKSAIINLISQPNQREKNARNAKNEALNYSWDKNVNLTLKFIEQIHEKHYGKMEK